MRIISIVIAGLILSGCVTPQILSTSGQEIDFKKYKSVNLNLMDGVNTSYSKEGTPLFEGLLKGKLQSLGYSLVDSGEDMAIQVKITSFDPGNRAVRLLVGFGAGKAILTYIATFKDRSGTKIAEMTGGKPYHGMELLDNPLFYTDEKIQMGMIQESVSQLSKFIQNNGKLE